LTKNISCLFKTAQLEIQRKNNEIEELRKQVTNLQQRRPQYNQQRSHNNNRGDNSNSGDNRFHKDQKNQQQSRPNPNPDRDREKNQRNDDRKASSTHHSDRNDKIDNMDDRRSRLNTSGSTDNKNSRSAADQDSKAVNVK
jgi:hypothetical protein